MRKFLRVQVSGVVTKYFSRLDAAPQGEITDVSLTCMGVLAELPFPIRGR